MHQHFETFLAAHCAPVLFGKKPAALFPQKHLPEECDWKELYRRGLRTLTLPRKQTTVILLYNPALLCAVLDCSSVQCTLCALGYPTDMDYRALLRYLASRFCEAAEFPHEVGFFLGYPPADVIGFMECQECKLCGPWKVFGDVAQAQSLFQEYTHCRNVLLAQIKNGQSIFNIDLPAFVG